MVSKLYRTIEHTADTGFEVSGSTKKQVFRNAALAFFDIMWRPASRQDSSPVSIDVAGSDLKALLVNFLEEFLYLYDAKGLICTDLKILNMTETSIKADAWLQLFDENADLEILGVKAVTYHQLSIEKKDNEWQAQVFLDI
jgi:SHS2 domain-containing protein